MSPDLDPALRIAGRLVAAVYDMPEDVFLTPRKGPPTHVQARQLVIYLLTMEGGFDQKEVAERLLRHHSTAWHANQRIEALREDPDLDRGITDLAEMYRRLVEAAKRVPPALSQEPAPCGK